MAKSRLTKRQRKRLRKTLAALDPPPETLKRFSRSQVVDALKKQMAMGICIVPPESDIYPGLKQLLSEAHGKP
jgi:hypothetical protein